MRNGINSGPGDVTDHPPLPQGFVERVLRFLRSPFHKKSISIAFRLRTWFQEAPLLLRLPCGAWWIIENSRLDHALLGGGFEEAEIIFVERFLQAGMTVLDVGAHHGLYTLLASKKVGRNGKVISFEPSPRERRRLSRHVRLNCCRNVRIERYALGAGRSRSRFYVIDGREDWCNSLRPPAVTTDTQQVEVEVLSLDEYLMQSGTSTVDFLKIDAEGGELDVLRGASALLTRSPRPIILMEVSDLRTGPWGYHAREIITFLEQRGYRWFGVVGGGTLVELTHSSEKYDANLVAIPTERGERASPLRSRPNPSVC